TMDICRKSIYEYLEEDLGLSIGFAKKEITIEEPTKEDRKLLDFEGFHSIVVVKSHVYLDNASLFQFTESRHRPDKFRFVDFARRK
uniref:UTRA domain-containing protein n=1 Tax=Streptomyces atratus TaxID=1893 RepID=UPI0036D40B41